MILYLIKFSNKVFLGWFRILKNTLYLHNKEENIFLNAEGHAFFLTFLLHSMNCISALRFCLFYFFHQYTNTYVSLSLTAFFFVAGYRFYFSKGAASELIEAEMKSIKFFGVIVTLAYAVLSFYIFLFVGDYIRTSSMIVGSR
jgi:hypothetical protein